MTTRSTCPVVPAPGEKKSFRYSDTGQRLDPGGGTYFIPEDELACAVARMQTNRGILNRYRFVPSRR
jgi:hypothetical protein